MFLLPFSGLFLRSIDYFFDRVHQHRAATFAGVAGQLRLRFPLARGFFARDALALSALLSSLASTSKAAASSADFSLSASRGSSPASESSLALAPVKLRITIVSRRTFQHAFLPVSSFNNLPLASVKGCNYSALPARRMLLVGHG